MNWNYELSFDISVSFSLSKAAKEAARCERAPVLLPAAAEGGRGAFVPATAAFAPDPEALKAIFAAKDRCWKQKGASMSELVHLIICRIFFD